MDLVAGSEGLAAAATLTVALLSACTHLPPPAHPRPALPLPTDIARRYAVAGPVHEEALVPIGGEDGTRFFRGTVTAGVERADFFLLLPDGDPRPFVMCLPILAGGEELMWIVGQGLADRGYAVAWTKRVASGLRAGQGATDLEEIFRRTVVHNRMVLAWARTQPEIDGGRTGCLGLSMGGMIGAALIAVEPTLRGGALCLAGGDLADLLIVSTEDRALKWRKWRHRHDGLGGAALRDELARELQSDPARLGAYVPTRKVLLVGGAFDDVVPRRHQDLLWEGLGRPERRLFPLGHYSAALAIGPIFGAVDRFLRRRFAASD
ncbi:MAG: hypothetical protein AAF628_07455 [Planctomycetota bacterium]